MENKNIDVAIQPYINCDGYYCQCPNDYTEVYLFNKRCSKCNQLLDWAWITEGKTDKEIDKLCDYFKGIVGE